MTIRQDEQDKPRTDAEKPARPGAEPRPAISEPALPVFERLDAIARLCGKLPIRSRRSEDDILGHGERGLPRSRWSNVPEPA